MGIDEAKELMEQALGTEKGLKVEFESATEQQNALQQFNRARSHDRKENKKQQIEGSAFGYLQIRKNKGDFAILLIPSTVKGVKEL